MRRHTLNVYENSQVTDISVVDCRLLIIGLPAISGSSYAIPSPSLSMAAVIECHSRCWLCVCVCVCVCDKAAILSNNMYCCGLSLKR